MNITARFRETSGWKPGRRKRSSTSIIRYHRTIKSDCIRERHIESVDDARRVVQQYVIHYNEVRLHSALGYVTPKTKMEGREKEVFEMRDRKLESAREQRRQRRESKAVA